MTEIFLENCQVKHRFAKRTFDILFSIAAICVLSPIFLLIALAVRCTSSGKAIYRHERIGRGGKPFYCYKFRTMYIDADQRLKKLLKQRAFREEWIKARKLKNDPRVTPIGNFLRKCSLDELPQFWNVIKGDLSIVGPRPVVKEEVIEYFGERAHKILSMRPGLTCLWQVSGRNDLNYSKRLELDEKYIDNHSLLLDVSLILKTIPKMISTKGAY